MPIPVWPQINYLADMGSWKLSPSDGKGRTSSDMDNGATRGRRRFTTTIALSSFNITMTDFESQLFEYFYKNDLADGTRWFTMPVLASSGVGYTPHLVRFPLGYNPEFSGAGFRNNQLSVSLEIRNLIEISGGAYYFFSVLGIATATKMVNALHTFIHVTYPQDQE